MSMIEPLPDYSVTVAEFGDPTETAAELTADLQASELPQFAECPLIVQGARGDE